mgnify:CR=1 FL=1
MSENQNRGVDDLSKYDVMSTEETALALGVSTKTVYRLLRDNKISHIKMGRTYRVPKAHLFSFLCLVSSECNSI